MKLLELQKAIKPIVKDSENPFYKSKYFDINSLIADIKPILNDLGLIIMQPLSNINGKTTLKTLLIDEADGKILIDSETILPENNDPQKMGAIITYFRRYSLQSLLLLEAEDDDGNMAVEKPTTQNTYQLAKAPIQADTCKFCGGKMVLNPKTGKVFCENKCWLKKEPEINIPENPFDEPEYPPYLK